MLDVATPDFSSFNPVHPPVLTRGAALCGWCVSSGLMFLGDCRQLGRSLLYGSLSIEEAQASEPADDAGHQSRSG